MSLNHAIQLAFAFVLGAWIVLIRWNLELRRERRERPRTLDEAVAMLDEDELEEIGQAILRARLAQRSESGPGPEPDPL